MADVRINARSTLNTLNKWIEVVSGNLTGAQIYGYKGTRISFGDTLVDTIRNGTGTTTIGGLNPVQLPSGGITVGSTATDFRQGSIVQTGDNNHLALQGNAWFATANPAGSINYTRNGEFHFDDAGNFVADNGDFVLGVFDQNKGLVKDDKYSNRLNGEMILTGGLSNIRIGSSTTQAHGMIPRAHSNDGSGNRLFSFLDDPARDGDQDRMIATSFMKGGPIWVTNSAGALTTNASDAQLMTINAFGSIVTVKISLNPETNNKATNTAYDNAVLIANAINAKASETGVGVSIVRDKKEPDAKVALVFAHVQRTLSEDYYNFTQSGDGGNPMEDLKGQDIGVLGNFVDNQGNLYHKINIKTLIASSPEYRPLAGDKFSFDGTGQLINNSRGKDAASAPPFATGIHVAIAKFSNQDGLSKTRGSSRFTYSDAAGQIITGFAGQVKNSTIDKNLGIQRIGGESTIGSENTIIPQSLEASNTSITDMLPELTIAQKTFTSNSKVVNVGNSIVDDLNGLIR